MFDNVFIWAQVAGLLGILCCVISMQFKNPKHIILGGVPSGALWAVQYMLLSAPMGAFTAASSAAHKLIAAYLPKNLIPYLIGCYLALIWSIGFYKLDVWYALCPLIGTSLGSIALLIGRHNRAYYARIIVIAYLCWATYNSIVGSYMGLACDALTITSSIVGMYRHEEWELNKCYKRFFPSLVRSLLVLPSVKTYP